MRGGRREGAGETAQSSLAGGGGGSIFFACCGIPNALLRMLIVGGQGPESNAYRVLSHVARRAHEWCCMYMGGCRCGWNGQAGRAG